MGVLWSLQAIRKDPWRDLTKCVKRSQNICRYDMISYDFIFFSHISNISDSGTDFLHFNTIKRYNMYTLWHPAICRAPGHICKRETRTGYPWVPSGFRVPWGAASLFGSGSKQYRAMKSSCDIWDIHWPIHWKSSVTQLSGDVGSANHAHDIPWYFTIYIYFTISYWILRFIEIFRKSNVDFPQSIRAWQWHAASPYVSLKAKVHLQQVQTSWLLCLEKTTFHRSLKEQLALVISISSDFGYFWIIEFGFTLRHWAVGSLAANPGVHPGAKTAPEFGKSWLLPTSTDLPYSSMTLWYIMVGCCVWCTCQNLRTRRARIWLHMSDSCQWEMKSNRSISVVEVRTVCMAPLIQRQCQCVFGPCIISWKLGWCPNWSLYSVGVELFVNVVSCPGKSGEWCFAKLYEQYQVGQMAS